MSFARRLRRAALLVTTTARWHRVREWRNYLPVVLEPRRTDAERVRLRAQLTEARRRRADAELRALKAELNPHLLGNALQSVKGLMRVDVAAADRVLTPLGALLRSISAGAETTESTLAEELESLTPFLEIEHARLIGRLVVDVDVAREALDVLVPDMILQPLVENAVKHGLLPLGGGRIRISAHGDASTSLTLRVEDNGVALGALGSTRASRKGGVGLSNIRARLAVLYGSRAALQLQRGGLGTEVCVTVPWHSTAIDVSSGDEALAHEEMQPETNARAVYGACALACALAFALTFAVGLQMVALLAAFATCATVAQRLLWYWQCEVRRLRLHSELEATRRHQVDAELRALKAELNPHFVGNALQAVSTLMRVDVNAAEHVIDQLDDLLQSAVARADVQEVTLREELETLEPFLAVERVRLGRALDVHCDMDDEALRSRVPHMILQPLVENAVKHGLAPSSAAVRIELWARPAGEMLELVVHDDGVGLAHSAERALPARTGVGLANARARLSEMYGTTANLELVARDRGTEARLTIPRRAEPARVGPASTAGVEGSP